MRHAEDPNTQREQEREREIATMATHFKEKGEKPVTPLSSQKPKNQNHILSQNQNPKLRWERSKRSEVPFSRNLRFSHTMVTDSSDQLNFNPTTTTEENPKQILDDDTTTTVVTPTKSSRRKRRGRTNRWGLWSTFCSHCRFRSEVRRGFEENCSRYL